MFIIAKSGPEHIGGVMKVYDHSDPAAWEQAGRERAAWGRERTEIHTRGGALEASA